MDSPASSDARAALLRLAGPLVALKLLVLLLVPLSRNLLPPLFNHASYIATYEGNFGVRPAGPPPPAYAFQTWDADHYLDIAQNGYAAHAVNLPFFPLWPMAIRIGSWVAGGQALAAGIVLANLFSLAAFLLLYEDLRRRTSQAIADRTLLLLLAFPGALFFCFPYSESLFLLLVAGAMIAHERRWPVVAAILAFGASMTRSVGVVLLLPLAVKSASRRDGWRDLLVPAAPVLGFGAYLGVMKIATGNAFAGFDIQRSFIAAPSLGALLNPVAFVSNLLHVTSLHGFLGSLLDRLMFAWVVAGCVLLAVHAVRHRCIWTWGLLALAVPLLVMTAVPARLMSFTRYAAVIYPAHFAMARALDKPAARPWVWVIVGGFAAVQLLMLLRHINHIWAG